MPIYESELRSLYWEQGLSIAQIAKAKQSDVATIHKYMVKFGVPRRSLSEAIRLSKLGELNPNWHGDNIKAKSGRERARRMYPPQPCRICGKAAERHHKDGNPLNNKASNIDFLCRKHHMEADKRLEGRNQRGQFIGAECGLLS